MLHVAGVGSSPVVRYQGYGAYFLDRLEPGIWRLEVMPDAITVRDPFEKASPAKEVVRIQWEEEEMRLNLPDLGDQFTRHSVECRQYSGLWPKRWSIFKDTAGRLHF